MEILKGIELVDLSLYIEEHKTLIIADSHMGFEEALNKEGLMVPRFQFKEVMDKINDIFDEIKEIEEKNNKNKKNEKKHENNKNNEKNRIKTIIINGDIKHEFGQISEQEWRETLKLIELMQKNCERLVMIKGNHDTILGPIAGKRGIEITDKFVIDNIYICHGHKIPDNLEFAKSKTIIIGHEHPAVSLKQGSRAELYKCFLKGRYKGKNLIVMPSLNLVTEGTDIMRETVLSPFLQQSLRNFEAYVVADNIYYFGKLRNLI